MSTIHSHENKRVVITITGPSGSGKTLIADVITAALDKARKPVKVTGIKQYENGTSETLEVTFNIKF